MRHACMQRGAGAVSPSLLRCSLHQVKKEVVEVVEKVSRAVPYPGSTMRQHQSFFGKRICAHATYPHHAHRSCTMEGGLFTKQRGVGIVTQARACTVLTKLSAISGCGRAAWGLLGCMSVMCSVTRCTLNKMTFGPYSAPSGAGWCAGKSMSTESLGFGLLAAQGLDI